VFRRCQGVCRVCEPLPASLRLRSAIMMIGEGVMEKSSSSQCGEAGAVAT